jgi:Spy/CpxP family protein refolding chaperone
MLEASCEDVVVSGGSWINKNGRSFAVWTTLLAITLAASTAIAIPVIARSADNPDTLYAQEGPMGRHWDGDDGGRETGPHGWPMMHGMMHHMMHRDPQERCTERLAWRAAMRAYAEAKLNLTAEQRPLWDKVQSAAQAEEQKERQLCAAMKPDAEPTLLDRMDRMQQFLSTRLEGLQSAKPAVQALYQALTPEQRAILDHPFHR